MAIDSREKRTAISSIQHFMVPGVTPNASKDQEWRQEAGWGYPGILAGSPSVTTIDYTYSKYRQWSVGRGRRRT